MKTMLMSAALLLMMFPGCGPKEGELFLGDQLELSTDGGFRTCKTYDASMKTWDTFTLAAGRETKPVALLALGNRVLVQYTATDSTGILHQVLRRSQDGGVTWETVEDYQKAAGKNTSGLMLGAIGNVFYSAILTTDLNDEQKFTYRKSTDFGKSWTVTGEETINNFIVLNQYINQSVARRNGFYQAGYRNISAGKRWTVRKSTDEGRTWVDVDYYQPSATHTDVHADGIWANQNGDRVYAWGRTQDDAGVYHTVVRRSEGQGNASTWANIFDDTDNDEGIYTVRKVYEIASVIYVVGTVKTGNDSEKEFWFVNKSTDNGATWTRIDTYQLTDKKKAEATDITVAGTELFVSGFASDGSKDHMIIKRSVDAGATWTIVDNFQLSTASNAYPLFLSAYQPAGKGLGITSAAYANDSGVSNTGILRSLWCTQ